MRWVMSFSGCLLALTLGSRVAHASCENGVQDGAESDVDCGGDCGPCAHGRACRGSRDCQSGRCAAYVCEERPYVDGDPVPPGYRVESSSTDSSATVRTIGIIALGAGYAGAYLAALALPGELTALYIPVVGPWVAIADESQEKKGLIALDGAFQVVGFSLLVGGILTGGSQLLREQPLDEMPVQVSAGRTRDGGYQVGVQGHF
jgi:hypothetical protein